MQKNENDLDRVVRAGISVAALGTGLAIGGPFNPVGVALLGVSGIAAATAVTGYCPLYSVLGISTLGEPNAEPTQAG
ncbi:MAG: hypothetical protein QG597_4950 [Actinomycetota bacterium]|nr:hypothetical protein [Actinomycetota bacterium]